MNRSVSAVRHGQCARGAAFRLGAGLMCVAGMGAAASGAIILDPGFFGSIPHTKIDFETDGSGAAIMLSPGVTMVMPAGAYAPQGVGFSAGVRWVHDGGGDTTSVRNLLGLGDISVSTIGVNTIDLTFSTEVRAFGMWVLRNHVLSMDPPSFEVYGLDENLLDTIVFTPVPGQEFGVMEWGFLGFESDDPIGRVRITKDVAIFDDLYFSAVPSPGTGAGLLTLLAAASYRRRRR